MRPLSAAINSNRNDLFLNHFVQRVEHKRNPRFVGIIPKSLFVNLLLSGIFFFLLFGQTSFAADENALSTSPYRQSTKLKNDLLNTKKMLVKSVLLYQKAKYDSSLIILKTAMPIFKKYEYWKGYYECVNYTANNLTALGKHNEVLKIVKEAKKLCESGPGSNSSEMADIFHTLGFIYDDMQDYKLAIEYYLKALSIKKNLFGEDHKYLSSTYNNLGVAYKNLSELDQALIYYLKDLKIIKKHYGPNHSNAAYSYTNIGNIYEAKGLYEQALNYHLKALAINVTRYGKQHPEIATNYFNIGLVYKKKGDFYNAITYFEIALLIDKETFGNEHDYVAGDYLNLGTTYYSINEYNLSLEYFIKALEIYKKDYENNLQDIADIYNNIGLCYYRKNDYTKALKLYLESKMLAVSIFGDNHPVVADVFLNIGDVYAEQDLYKNALESYKLSLKLFKKIYGEKHPNIAKNYLQMSKLYYLKQNRAVALNHNDLALKALHINNDKIVESPADISSNILYLRALVLRTQILLEQTGANPSGLSQYDQALLTFEKAINFIFAISSQFKSEGSKLFLNREFAHIFDEALVTAMLLYRKTGNVSYSNFAFRISELSKARVLSENLAKMWGLQFSGVPESIVSKENELSTDLAFYSTELIKEELVRQTANYAKIKKLKEKKFELKRSYAKLMSGIEKNYPHYHEMKYNVEPAKVSAIQESIGESTALLEYFIGDSSLYIFCLTTSKMKFVANSIDSAFITDLKNFIRTIKKYDKKSFLKYSALFYNKTRYRSVATLAEYA